MFSRRNLPSWKRLSPTPRSSKSCTASVTWNNWAMLILLVVSVLAGIGMLGVFRSTTNQEGIRQAKRRIQAHLYEMRLFPDEPVLMMQAQRGLLAANVRYISLMLVPALVLLAPMLLILGQLQCLY